MPHLRFLSEASGESSGATFLPKKRGLIGLFEVNFLALFQRNFGFIINKHLSEFSVLNM